MPDHHEPTRESPAIPVTSGSIEHEERNSFGTTDQPAWPSRPSFQQPSSEAQSTRNCIICMSAIAPGTQATTAPCNPSCFDAKCLLRWLMTHTTCPICRQTVITVTHNLSPSPTATPVTINVAWWRYAASVQQAQETAPELSENPLPGSRGAILAQMMTALRGENMPTPRYLMAENVAWRTRNMRTPA